MAAPSRMVRDERPLRVTTASSESASAPSRVSRAPAPASASSTRLEPPSSLTIPATLPPLVGKPSPREIVQGAVARRVTERPSRSWRGAESA